MFGKANNLIKSINEEVLEWKKIRGVDFMNIATDIKFLKQKLYKKF